MRSLLVLCAVSLLPTLAIAAAPTDAPIPAVSSAPAAASSAPSGAAAPGGAAVPAPAPTAPASPPKPWDPTKLPAELRKLGFTDDDWEEVRDREVVVHSETFRTTDGKDAARAYAGVLVKKSWEACFDTVRDYGKMPAFMPRLEEVKIVEQSSTHLRVLQTIGVLTSTIRYGLRLDFDREHRTIDYKLDPATKSDIRATDGRWLFVPLPDGTTFIRYTIFADTGMAVPGFVADFLMRKDLPGILENFRDRVESGGRFTK